MGIPHLIERMLTISGIKQTVVLMILVGCSAGIFGVGYLKENANIDFYDTEIIVVSASTMYTF